MSKSKAIVLAPAYNADDISNARAYGIAMSFNIGNTGRVPQWALEAWHNALRPNIVSTNKNASPGNGNNSNANRVVIVDGIQRNVETSDYQHARIWATENNIAVPARGRMPLPIVQQWIDAGMPTHRRLLATVYYVKRNAVTKALLAKEHAVLVYADMLPTRRGVRSNDEYVSHVPDNGVPVRIETDSSVVHVASFGNGMYSYRKA